MYYTPSDWYWRGPLGVYSSARQGIVSLSDATWTAREGLAQWTPWPMDDVGEQTAEALDAVLIAAGLPPTGLATPTLLQLVAYAQNKAQAIEAGGISVNIALSGPAQNVECATDPVSVGRLTAAYAFAQANPSETVTYPFVTGPEMLNAAQVTTIFNAVMGFYQATTNELSAAVSAINATTITSFAQIDALPWPANS